MTETSSKPQRYRHLLVLANPSHQSFDHAIAHSYAEVVAGHQQDIVIRDLYATGFDPLLKAWERPGAAAWSPAPDVAAELEQLRACNILVFVYPIWFGLPPAMLKGYVERVLGAGYTVEELQTQAGQATVQGKPLLSITTSGAPLDWLDSQGQVVGLKNIFDVYLWRGLAMSRAEHLRIDGVVPGMAGDYAAEQLDRVREAAANCCDRLASGAYAREAEAEAARRARKQQETKLR